MAGCRRHHHKTEEGAKRCLRKQQEKKWRKGRLPDPRPVHHQPARKVELATGVVLFVFSEDARFHR